MVLSPPKKIEKVTLADFNERIMGTHPYSDMVEEAFPCECDSQKASGLTANFDKYDCHVCDNCNGVFWRSNRGNHY